jgi:pimeloyl-ACP methyl ester carboxylesterase
MMDIIWPASMETDAVGATWDPGVLRAPGRIYWGWNAASAARLTTPTLVMVGEYDGLYDSNVALFDALGAASKAFLGIECASHFAAWEMQRHVLHATSREWLACGTLTGRTTGTFCAAANGTIAPADI